MVCAYANANWESKTYLVTMKDNAWDKSIWFEGAKPALLEKNPLVNLPYVLDGDVLVTQTNACLYYLGRKFGLNGSNETEISRVDQVLCEVMDLRNASTPVFYGRDTDTTGWIENRIHTHLKKLNDFMELNGTAFSASNSPTVGDFHMWEIIDHNCEFAASLGKACPIDNYPRLKAFYTTFRALKQLQPFFASEHYNLPINNTHAKFGAKSLH